MKPQSLILAVLGTLWLSFPAGVGRASYYPGCTSDGAVDAATQSPNVYPAALTDLKQRPGRVR